MDICKPMLRKGGRYGWKPSSSSNFPIRVVRAYPLIEIRQTIIHRAVRGNGISVNSTLPPLTSVARSTPRANTSDTQCCGNDWLSRNMFGSSPRKSWSLPVSSHTLNSQNVKSRVSNHMSKYIVNPQ